METEGEEGRWGQRRLRRVGGGDLQGNVVGRLHKKTFKVYKSKPKTKCKLFTNDTKLCSVGLYLGSSFATVF